MNEKLIKDYCLANNIGYYLSDGGVVIGLIALSIGIIIMGAMV